MQLKPYARFFCGILSIILIIIIEIIFFISTDPLTGIPVFEPTGDDANVIAKRRLMEKTDGAIVLIGDSSCMMGLIPKIIEQSTQTTCINLGTLSSFTMAGIEALIQEILEKDFHPKAIVIAVLPQTLETTIEQSRQYGLVGRYLIAYRQTSRVYTPDFSDLERWFFRKHQFNIFPPEFGGSFTNFYNALEEEQGFYQEPRVYGGFPREKRQHISPSAFSKNAIIRISELASMRKIPLVWWWSPIPEDSVTASYIADAEELIRDLEQEYPFVIYQTSPPVWSLELFGSESHVNLEGAIRNTQKLVHSLCALTPNDVKHTKFDNSLLKCP